MADIFCDLNAGMERSFYASLPDSDPIDLTKHANYHLYFDLVPGSDPDSEQRHLRVVPKGEEEAILTVKLNKNAGYKPADGTVTPYKPTVKPMIFRRVRISTDEERIFFADVNMSATAGISVIMTIDPYNTEVDNRRYLTFSSTSESFPSELEGEEFDLDDSGGKKPLGGGRALADAGVQRKTSGNES